MAERRAQVLIVDPDPEVGREVLSYLEERGYAAEWVNGGEKAYNLLDSRPFDALITELHLQHADSMRLMSVARERNPDSCVVFIAHQPDITRATEAMRQGAYDFQIKPLNLGKLEAVIKRGLAYQQLVLEQVELKRRLDERFGLGNLVGRSRQMTRIYSLVRQIGPAPDNVLIYGEPGTDKRFIAQAIHNSSGRRDAAYVSLECSRLPDHLIESELFGPQKRPATHPGRIELADQGTLHIGGIEALSPKLQDQLLAVLTSGAVPNAEGSRLLPVDVRFICTTSQRLDHLVEEGRCSPELARQLGQVVIEAPALRARREDIPLLIDKAIEEAAVRHGRRPNGMTRNAMNLLAQYDWPGNVGELRTVIEGMVATARTEEALGVQDIPAHVRQRIAPEAGEIRIPTGATMREIERIAIEETMKICGYNKDACAKILGIGLRTLYRKLKLYDIR